MGLWEPQSKSVGTFPYRLRPLIGWDGTFSYLVATSPYRQNGRWLVRVSLPDTHKNRTQAQTHQPIFPVGSLAGLAQAALEQQMNVDGLLQHIVGGTKQSNVRILCREDLVRV